MFRATSRNRKQRPVDGLAKTEVTTFTPQCACAGPVLNFS